MTLYELYSKKFNVNDLITRFIDLVEINNLELILIYKNILSDNQIFIMDLRIILLLYKFNHYL